jgi:hypothetical protein
MEGKVLHPARSEFGVYCFDKDEVEAFARSGSGACGTATQRELDAWRFEPTPEPEADPEGQGTVRADEAMQLQALSRRLRRLQAQNDELKTALLLLSEQVVANLRGSARYEFMTTIDELLAD